MFCCATELQFALCSTHVSLAKRCEFNFWCMMTILKITSFDLQIIFAIEISIVRNFTAFSLQVAFTMRSLIFQLCAILSVRALENPIPSSFLQPRNFNPHPYQAEASKYLLAPGQYQDYHGLGLEQNYQELSRKIQKFVFIFIIDIMNKFFVSFHSTGPIQFPENNDSEAEGEQKEQALEQRRRIVSHIAEKQALIPHPYERLALNYRSQQLHRYSGNVRKIIFLINKTLTEFDEMNRKTIKQRKYFLLLLITLLEFRTMNSRKTISFHKQSF